jgi:hypothetical protein
MSQADETAGMRRLRLAHAIIDQPADRDIRLIEAAATRQHAGVDAGRIHHADMRGEIGKKRVEQIIWVAVTIEIDRDPAGIAFEQIRGRVVLLKIDEHFLTLLVIPDAAKRFGIHIHRQ